VARVPWCEPTEGFCSPRFDIEPSNQNERSMMFWPSLGPSGRETLPAKTYSRPRLRIGLVRERASGTQASCMNSSPSLGMWLGASRRNARVGRGLVFFFDWAGFM
jgi:hypothetical protein